MSNGRIRVLIAKAGLDGHDRGAKVIVRALCDAGMEVYYTGLRQTPEQIVEAAIRKDVQIVGLSSLSGAHMYLFPPVVQLLHEQGHDDILVIGGGVIPEEDIPYLKNKGLSKIFTPGTIIEEIINYIKDRVSSGVEDELIF